jgi:Predicted transcriptional regulators
MDNLNNECNFTALGLAIKRARQEKGLTREELAKILNLVPRYIQSIENEGQHPSLQVLYRFVTFFNLSIDEYLLPNINLSKSTLRRQLDSILNSLDEKDLLIVSGTLHGICKAKEAEK